MRALSFILVFICFLGYSQNLREEFEQAKKRQSSEFERFQEQNDSLFARFIQESWHKVKGSAPLVKERYKPKALPVFEKDSLHPKTWDNLPSDTLRIMRSFTPDKLESPDKFPELSKADLQFYGAQFSVRFPLSIHQVKPKGKGDQLLSNYWKEASKYGYQVVLEDLLSYRDTYALPDYAFYLMVKTFANRSGLDKENQVLQVWFLMNKAGYACKIGFEGEEPVLLLGIKGKVYGKQYFHEDDIRYYAMTEVGDELYTYGNPESANLRQLSLEITDPVELPINPGKRNYVFDFREKTYEIELFYNRNISDLMQDFPEGEINNYLNSEACALLSKSVHKVLDPILIDYSEVDKIRFLLAFVQSLPYMSDQAQFNKEEIFYPDEFVAFEHSDCDDRVVFLAYLINEFTDVNTVAVVFPRHVALALQLPAPWYGESILFEQKKYTFCDPTYFGAPLGALIPEADPSKARIKRILK